HRHAGALRGKDATAVCRVACAVCRIHHFHYLVLVGSGLDLNRSPQGMYLVATVHLGISAGLLWPGTTPTDRDAAGGGEVGRITPADFELRGRLQRDQLIARSDAG